jgi:hypothetical protein
MTERLNPKPEAEVTKLDKGETPQEVELRSAQVVRVGGMIVSSAKRRQIRRGQGERGPKETKLDKDLLGSPPRLDKSSVAFRWSGGGVASNSRASRPS